jgi:hypothetical protein
MKYRRSTMAIAVLGILAFASPVVAQFWPNSPYMGYGVWGEQFNTTRDIAQQNYQTGQIAAMGQNMAVQSGIRNTLINQAQTQTSALQSQRQSNKDWWFQMQEQQMAERRATAGRSSQQGAFQPSSPAVAYAEPRPTASTDIIPWLPVLQDPRFSAERAAIESPYRRASSGLSTPTPADYRNMLKSIDRMKAILRQITGELSARDYLQADAFLDKMAQEARERS